MDKQDKPLSEWTLGEVQALCERRNGDGCCDECPFANVIGNCTLRVLPEEWELEEVRRLTEPEIAIMRAVGAKWVSRDVCGSKRIELWDEKPIKNKDGAFHPSVGNGSLAIVRESLFPSVNPGECIELEECMGAGDGQ